MAEDQTIPWKSIESMRVTAFLVGGAMFVVATAFVVFALVTGAERTGMMVGQAFIAAGWVASLIGLLGLYDGLADRSPKLARVGALFAAIGVVTFAVMAVSVLVYFAGIPEGTFDAIVVFFLPGVVIGSLLAFVTFGIASLRSGPLPQAVGVLLLVPSTIFVVNLLKPVDSMHASLVIDSGLVLTMLAIGFLLRSEGTPSHHERVAPSREPTTR